MSSKIQVKYTPTGTFESVGLPFWLVCTHADYEQDGQRVYCDYCDKMGMIYEEEEYEGTDEHGDVEVSRHTMIEWFD